MKKGFKAFEKGLICRGKQYKEGEIFEENEIKICEKGMHYCENPLDVLDFYDLTTSEFAEIEDVGNAKKEDNKSVTNNFFKVLEN